MKAFTPTGKLIIATCDTVCANANIKIDEVSRNADGTLEIDFDGESDVSWDSQRTLTDERGVTLYVAEDGTEWPEDCIHLEGEELRPMPVAPVVAPSLELLGTIARMTPYSHGPDCQEDAVETMNALIAKAQALVNAPVVPSADWRQVAHDLAGALSACTDQIHQMKDMFDDEDAMIQEALDDADAASADFMAAVRAPIGAISIPPIAIVIQGGNVTAVISDHPELIGQDITVIDYDADDADEVVMIPQDAGKPQRARVWGETIEKAGLDIAAVRKMDPEPVF